MGGYPVPLHIRGCLDDQNDQVVAYDPVTCSFRRSAMGSGFLSLIGPDGRARPENPAIRGVYLPPARMRRGRPTLPVRRNAVVPDIAGDRISLIPNLKKGSFTHVLNGAFNKGPGGWLSHLWHQHLGFDWSLIYANHPAGESGTFDFNSIRNDPESPLGTLSMGMQPTQAVCLVLAHQCGGRLRKGCAAACPTAGKTIPSNDGAGSMAGGTVLVGADVFGYNNPHRFRSKNAKGALNDNGTPVAKKHNAVRGHRLPSVPPPTTTMCGRTCPALPSPTTISTTPVRCSASSRVSAPRKSFCSCRATGGTALSPIQLTARDWFSVTNFHNYTGVWRSMVGFDLLRSIRSFRYIPFLITRFPTSLVLLRPMADEESVGQHRQPSVSRRQGRQWVYRRSRRKADRGRMASAHYSNAQCRRYRWDHLFTLGLANQGLFASRLETRNAVVVRATR